MICVMETLRSYERRMGSKLCIAGEAAKHVGSDLCSEEAEREILICLIQYSKKAREGEKKRKGK